MAVKVAFTLTDRCEGKQDLGFGRYASQQAMTRGLVLKADKVFGRGNWSMQHDTSLPGFTAVANALCDHRALRIEA